MVDVVQVTAIDNFCAYVEVSKITALVEDSVNGIWTHRRKYEENPEYAQQQHRWTRHAPQFVSGRGHKV